MDNERKRDDGVGEITSKKEKSDSTLTHNDYTVGWICALPKELTAATAMLDQQHPPLTKPPGDNNAYTLGSIRDHNIVTICLPKGMIGNVSAATVASSMANTFPFIKVGLMVGIGGGVPSNKVRLGDIVVSTSTGTSSGVIKWDSGKVHGEEKFERTGSLNNPPQTLLTALTLLETQHNLSGSGIPNYLEELKHKWPKLASKCLRSGSLTDILFKSSYSHILKSAREQDDDGNEDLEENDEEEESCSLCDKSMTVKRKPRDMLIHYGLIASGNKLIKDAASRNKLNKDLGGNVLCIEMEAAGLINQFPCLVIRGICDYADSHKNKDWQEYAAIVAAAFAKELLQCVQARELEGERPLKDLLEDVHSIVLETQQDVAEINARQRKHDDDCILDWLTGVDYGLQHSQYRSLRQPRTGGWLSETEEFQTWLAAQRQTLFCLGIPGAGKTILTSIVIDKLRSSVLDDSNIGIAYIYLSFQRQKEQTLDMLLSSLLKQLAGNLASMPEEVVNLHYEHDKERTRPTSKGIIYTLRKVIAKYSRVFIVIDALDEYGATGSSRKPFFQELGQLQREYQISFFMTSRFDKWIALEVEEAFMGVTRIEIEAATEDIETYVDGKVDILPPAVQENKDLREAIKEGIARSAEGMFLLAQVYLNLLCYQDSETEIRHQLAAFASRKDQSEKEKTDALADAYRQTMERIKQQQPKHALLAKQVLGWLSYAKRELTVKELQHAMATTSLHREASDADLPYDGRLVSVCAGLVTIDEKRKIIGLVHYTVQEYLKQKPAELLPMTERDIARTCISYLSFKSYKENHNYRIGWVILRSVLERWPFYHYAAKNWGHHARESAISEDELMDLLSIGARLVKSAEVLMVNEANKDHAYFASPPESITTLHLAAYFGLEKLVRKLVEFGIAVDVADSHGRTPLSYAAEHGYYAVVSLLLDKGAQPDSQGNLQSVYSGRTPLSLAAEFGHAAAAEMLLKREADPYSPCTNEKQAGWTPLSFAVENGHLRVTRLLLKWGLDFVQLELYRAARQGHEAIVHLLLEKGAAMEYQPVSSVDCLETAIILATQGGHENVVRLLLKNGAKPTVRVSGYFKGLTPLGYSAAHGHYGIFELLLHASKDRPDSVDGHGRTPLSWAADEGHLPIVGLLLANGADPDSKIIKGSHRLGRTPLWFAAQKGHEKIVRLLLEKDASVHFSGLSGPHQGRTPLSVAAEGGLEGIVRALLEKGSDPNSAAKSKDLYGRTPLVFAVENGHEAVVKLLLRNGAHDANSQPATPLLLAATNGHRGIEKLLLEADIVQIDQRDEKGRTPLSHMAEHGHEGNIQMLIQRGVDVDSETVEEMPPLKKYRGRTPLSFAAENGHQGIVELLIANGAQADSRLSSEIWWGGRTPLSFAARNNHIDVVQMLIQEDNVDADCADDDGRTPLSYAAEKGNTEVVLSLLQRGAKVDSICTSSLLGDAGKTPLSFAARGGHEETVACLLKNGASTDCEDAEGDTPLSLAIQYGYDKVAKLCSTNFVNLK
ncbi:hypothetical protein NW762_005352 [Fusarium torreyae]|uniref:Nucleoside phosphorylase domain-containing protein n=1 Tax=Fusarium torreyae TaxID=1237075 RepID=A0A9W8S4V7_9HYPO|nr:hypothetical protein NW762_005352 [Fusarium torreyae]